jgi:hypothetical protein
MARMISIPIVMLGVVAMLVAASPVEASVAGTELFLPAVGTGPGVPPSYWYTTVWVFNPADVSAEVEFNFLRKNQSNNPSDISETIMVGPGEVVQIDDAVTTLFGIQAFGAIRVLADVPVHVTARIFSQATSQTERDSSGQAFTAVPAQRAIGTGDETDLIGLTNLEGGDFRYNIGFVETMGQPASVQVTLLATSGSSWVYTSIQVQPFEQIQMSVDQLFNNAIGESDNFRLHVTGQQGDGRVIVYGSRVANGSQDATTFEMLFPSLP